jgi:amino acid transporter
MNLIMEYVLANAAVCRAFSGYFASLLGFSDTSYFITTWHSPNKTYYLDWWAMGIILVLTCLLIYGTKESAMFNNSAPPLELGRSVDTRRTHVPHGQESRVHN